MVDLVCLLYVRWMVEKAAHLIAGKMNGEALFASGSLYLFLSIIINMLNRALRMNIAINKRVYKYYMN